MKCPKCGTTLVKKFYKGMMEVECCPNCRGMWLDFDELDRLEDVAFDQDEYKSRNGDELFLSALRVPFAGIPVSFI